MAPDSTIMSSILCTCDQRLLYPIFQAVRKLHKRYAIKDVEHTFVASDRAPAEYTRPTVTWWPERYAAYSSTLNVRPRNASEVVNVPMRRKRGLSISHRCSVLHITHALQAIMISLRTKMACIVQLETWSTLKRRGSIISSHALSSVVLIPSINVSRMQVPIPATQATQYNVARRKLTMVAPNIPQVA